MRVLQSSCYSKKFLQKYKFFWSFLCGGPISASGRFLVSTTLLNCVNKVQTFDFCIFFKKCHANLIYAPKFNGLGMNLKILNLEPPEPLKKGRTSNQAHSKCTLSQRCLFVAGLKTNLVRLLWNNKCVVVHWCFKRNHYGRIHLVLLLSISPWYFQNQKLWFWLPTQSIPDS